MDQIKIENLEIFANHGVYPEENRLGQKFLVSCILYVDTRKAGKTDDLEASVNYGTISHLIKEKMEEKNYRLIEAVAEQLAEEILLFDEKIRKEGLPEKKEREEFLLWLWYFSLKELCNSILHSG